MVRWSKVYKTIKEAREIRMQCLLPFELAEFIKKGDPIKPVRLIKSDIIEVNIQ